MTARFRLLGIVASAWLAASAPWPAAAASESRTADAAGRPLVGGSPAANGGGDRLAAYRYEIDGFCSAIRTGSPLQCTPERAMGSAMPASSRR